MTHCEHCDNGVRRPVSKARLAERDGHTAVVLGVPVEECAACGTVWLPMDVAKRLDTMFRDMLSLDLEVVTRRYAAA
jgi:hypothetical protein